MTDYTGMTTTQERNQLIREVAARDGEIAALKREKSMTQDQWQPIETAPKDYAILMFSPKTGRSVQCWGTFCSYNQPGFTHWQTLPAPPKGAHVAD